MVDAAQSPEELGTMPAHAQRYQPIKTVAYFLFRIDAQMMQQRWVRSCPALDEAVRYQRYINDLSKGAVHRFLERWHIRATVRTDEIMPLAPVALGPVPERRRWPPSRNGRSVKANAIGRAKRRLRPMRAGRSRPWPSGPACRGCTCRSA